MQRNFKSEYLAARGIGGESRRLFASGAGNETPQSPTATPSKKGDLLQCHSHSPREGGAEFFHNLYAMLTPSLGRFWNLVFFVKVYYNLQIWVDCQH
mgnify:CR=1 FL=1